jgi:hypothetical protein
LSQNCARNHDAKCHQQSRDASRPRMAIANAAGAVGAATGSSLLGMRASVPPAARASRH